MATNEEKVVISDLAKVMSKTTLSRSTLYSYIKQGKFPSPIKLGDRAIGFIDAEVDAWIEERIKASRVGKMPSTIEPNDRSADMGGSRVEERVGSSESLAEEGRE